MKSLTAIALLTALSVGFVAYVDAKGREKPARPDFSSIDIDSSGAISFAEFSEQELPPGVDDIQIIFDEIDADKDGEISEQEFKDHKPPRRQR